MLRQLFGALATDAAQEVAVYQVPPTLMADDTVYGLVMQTVAIRLPNALQIILTTAEVQMVLARVNKLVEIIEAIPENDGGMEDFPEREFVP